MRSSKGLVASSALLKIVPVLGLMIHPAAQAQTFTVLHSFTGGADGSMPIAGLRLDHAGNLYGTTYLGGYFGGICEYNPGCGTVFSLVHKGSAWIFAPLYAFQGGNDGYLPQARVTIGPDGGLFGTTTAGGGGPCLLGGLPGCGTVFNLRPPAVACKAVLCRWMETVIHLFNNTDGEFPESEVVFDQAGNLYGTTVQGGANGDCSEPGDNCGVAYKLVPSNGSWTEIVLYDFSQPNEASEPTSGVIFDNAGNLYGTAGSSSGGGLVYQLAPGDPSWVMSVLYDHFSADSGEFPEGTLFLDASGNLYGVALSGGPGNAGIAYELSPSSNGWIFSNTYSFTYQYGGVPQGGLVSDRTGNLYGVAFRGGKFGAGTVFKLTPGQGGTWKYTSLHDFSGGADGANPRGSLIFDSTGNLYGTTPVGGSGNCSGGCGVVWEIQPNH